MLASTLATVLVPNWRVRSRRQKQEVADETVVSRLDVSSSEPLRTDGSQLRDVFPELSSRNNPSARLTEEQIGSSSSNVRTHVSTKLHLSNSFTVDMSGGLQDRADVAPPMTGPPASAQAPTSPRNLSHQQPRMTSQPGAEQRTFSSPWSSSTPSSLLFSLRRLNSSSRDTNPTSPTSPSKKVFRMSQQQSSGALQNSRAETFRSQTPPTSFNKKADGSAMHLGSREAKTTVFIFSSSEGDQELQKPQTTGPTETSFFQRGLSTPSMLKYSSLDFSTAPQHRTTPGSMLHRQRFIPPNLDNTETRTMSSPDTSGPNPLHSPQNLNSLIFTRHGSPNSAVHHHERSFSSLSSMESVCSSLRQRSFTDSLSPSDDKIFPSVERTDPSHVWQKYLDSGGSLRRQPLSTQSPGAMPNPLSPTRPLRSVRAPDIYSSLRPNSQTLSSSSSPNACTLQLERREVPVTSASPEWDAVMPWGQKMSSPAKGSTSRFNSDLSSPQILDNKEVLKSRSPLSLPPDLGSNLKARFSSSPYFSLISARMSPNSDTSPPLVSPVQDKSLPCDQTATVLDTSTAGRHFQSPLSASSVLAKSQIDHTDSPDNHMLVFRPVGPQGLTARYLQDTHDGNVAGENTFPCQSSAPSKWQLISEPDSHQRTTTQFTISSIKKEDIVDGRVKDNQAASEGKHFSSSPVTENQKRKRSLFALSSQKENVSPSCPSLSKDAHVEKNGSSGSKMDQVLNRIRQTFSIKRAEQESPTLKKKEKFLLKSSGSESSAESCRGGRLEGPSLKKEISVPSDIRKSAGATQLPYQDSKKPMTSQVQKDQQNHELVLDKTRNKSVQKDYSANRQSSHGNRYATLPAYRKMSASSSNLYSALRFDLEDEDNEVKFYRRIMPQRRNTSLSEAEDNLVSSSSAHGKERHYSGGPSPFYTDVKYGLDRRRSCSVTNVFSSRPSGPGRISTASKTSSVSDLSCPPDLINSDDVFYQMTSSPGGPQSHKLRTTQHRSDPSPQAEATSRSPSSPESTYFPWDKESDPTPPPSPPFSPTSRRMARIPSSSSTGSRTSQDSLSPRGLLPSKSYKASLSVFEESSSDSSTTDDEYYLGDGDGKETEF
ncbi:uncharacterized protein DDB_G0284459 [Denticeps clupeoides]|uniref:uncharacterized protein DDB_G0284459 n=1 Tax=Denticeps clupeoides TaxID=299321 RepID=UPI0010A2F7A3|nr:uncharacterized protein DDB_G0284459-like [Denticeps clupeoides]XP_028826732.1 uncharacterized protein DDB_G0284459-like [Denticeps clupeoides]XP_028826733.1 uncharacterized protein DDB_G0284459-like [Denticeps clupeoides]